MRKLCILAVLICTSSTLVACAPQATGLATDRDPIFWPFAADSIWNMPIHNDAEYVDAQIGMPMAAGVWVTLGFRGANGSLFATPRRETTFRRTFNSTDRRSSEGTARKTFVPHIKYSPQGSARVNEREMGACRSWGAGDALDLCHGA